MSRYVLLIDEDEPLRMANKSTGRRLTEYEARTVLLSAICRLDPTLASKEEEPSGSNVGWTTPDRGKDEVQT